MDSVGLHQDWGFLFLDRSTVASGVAYPRPIGHDLCRYFDYYIEYWLSMNVVVSCGPLSASAKNQITVKGDGPWKQYTETRIRPGGEMEINLPPLPLHS